MIYYASVEGDDNAVGTSPQTAWRTLEKLGQAELRGGDHVLMCGGEVFRGSLRLQFAQNGERNNPIVVGSYGAGRAVIEAGAGDGIVVESANGVSIRDLEVRGSGRATNQGSGVYLVNTRPDNEPMTFVRLENLETHGFGRDGITLFGKASDGSNSGFHDVRIAHCVAHDNALFGIRVASFWDDQPRTHINSQIVVSHCVAHSNPGDPDYMENHSGSGIFVNNTNGGLIEHCEAFENGALCFCPNGGPMGIWTAGSNDITIQHCHSHHNRAGARHDGGGFDFDGGVSNSLMQFNLSHDNDGAGYLLYVYAGAPHSFSSNTVRFNVSRDDGRKNNYGGISVGSHGEPVRDLKIHDNLITVSAQPASSEPATPAAIPCAAWVFGNVRNCVFQNNIFGSSDGAPLLRVTDAMQETHFVNNKWMTGNGSNDRFLIEWNEREFSDLESWQAGVEAQSSK